MVYTNREFNIYVAMWYIWRHVLEFLWSIRAVAVLVISLKIILEHFVLIDEIWVLRGVSCSLCFSRKSHGHCTLPMSSLWYFKNAKSGVCPAYCRTMVNASYLTRVSSSYYYGICFRWWALSTFTTRTHKLIDGRKSQSRPSISNFRI